MTGAGDTRLSSDLIDDILWNIENGPPNKGPRSWSPSPGPESELPWYEGHGPTFGADEIVLESSDGYRLTANLGLLQSHSTFIQNLCDVAPRSEAPVPPIQLDAPALVIQWLLTAVRRPDILHWCRIFREGIVPYEVPQGEYWIEVATTIQVYRLADYLGCEKVMSKMTEFWERFDCDTLLALLRAASTINDLEIGRTIIAMSETVFGRVYDELVSYAADHWEEVVGKLSPDWQLRLFHAFWRPSRQYLNRPECDTPRRPDGRRRNRPHEFIWIEARRTPQEIADLFLPQEHLKGGFDPPDECRPGSSEDRPRSDGRVE